MALVLLDVHNGLLSTISSKSKIAYALNLIKKEIYDEIKKISNIRNHFAHNHLELNFQTPEIEKICNSFQLWENRYPSAIVSDYRKFPLNQENRMLRKKFIDTVTEICNNFLVTGLIDRILYND